MKLLLDTHILIWTFTNGKPIAGETRKLIGSSANEIYFSLASVWEIAIKHAINADKMPLSEEAFWRYSIGSGFIELPVAAKHIFAVKTLQRQSDAPPRRDPFDRILIAQAKNEGMRFLTHDKSLSFYREPCIVLV